MGELTAYVPVIIGTQDIVIDDFESANGTFLSFPAVVTGNYRIGSFKKEGRSAGEISYDFTTTDATRAAYLVFNNEGIPLESKPQNIGLWVYGNEGGGHGLKLKMTDAKGLSENVTLAQSINWNGWKYIEAKLPASLTSPLKLERIYVVEINPAMKDTGKVYLDNLTLSYPLIFSEEVPSPVTTSKDLAAIKADLETTDAFRFFAYGSVTNIDTLLDNIVTSKMAKSINETSSINLFSGTLDHHLSEKLKAPLIITNKGYSYTEHSNSGFIALDNTNGGLRLSNSNQWPWLLTTLENSGVKNLFISLPKPLNFSDPLEENLFKNKLTELKEEKDMDIWILYGGENQYKVTLEDGIHYVALKNFPTVSKYNIYNDLDTLFFTVNKDKVTYEILPLFEQK